MTDNLFQDKTKLNKSTSSVATSLLDKIQRMKSQSKHNLLIDISGSMADWVESNEGESFSKYQLMLTLLEKIPQNITKYAFDSGIEEITDILPLPRGGTDMSRAFDYVKKKGKKEIVLITDGEPDSEKDALLSAKGLKIDIIYIGQQPQPAFLDKLANATGGSFTNIDLIQAGSVLELENKVQLLLGA